MSNKLYIPIIIGALGMLSASDASAQRMAVKSNLLADALASPNIGVEFLVSPRWTLDIAAHYQPFAPRDGRRWKPPLVFPPRSPPLAVHSFCRSFLGSPCLGRAFQCRRCASAFQYPEGRARGTLRRLAFGRRHFVWLPLGAFPALGCGSKSGCGGGFSPQRPLSLRSLRQQAARYERQGIHRPYKGSRVRGIYD